MPRLEHQVNLRSPRLRRQYTSLALIFPKRVIFIILGILIVATSGWYVWSTQQVAGSMSVGLAKESNNKELVAEVGKLIVLPSDEQPQIGTIVDPAQFPDDPLLSQSQVGDKLLVFAKARKAVLYRPSEHKVVDVMGFALPAEVEQSN